MPVKLSSYAIIGLAAVSLIVVVLLDQYVLPKQKIAEEVYEMHRKKRTVRRNYTFYEHYIEAQSGQRYRIWDSAYNKINPGDAFAVYISPIFKKKVKIEWCIDGECMSGPMQGFKDIYTALLFIVVPLILIVPRITTISKKSGRYSQFLFHCGWIAAIAGVIVYLVI